MSGWANAGEVDADLAVHRDLAAHACRQVRRAAIPVVAGSALCAVYLRHQVRGPWLWIWLGLVVLDTGRAWLNNRNELRHLADREPDRHYLGRNAPNYLCFGLVWGSLVLVASLWGTEEALWSTIVIVLAVASFLVLAGASSRTLYLVSLAGLFLPTVIGLWMWRGEVAWLGWLSLFYCAIAVLLHDALHGAVVDAVHTNHANRALATQLSQFMAARDPLTGLLNRRGFVATLERLASEADESGAMVAVAVLNVERLAAVNEWLGEAAGDELLVALAGRMHACISDTDAAARLGGDEFAVATVVHEHGEGRELADRLVLAMEDPVTVAGRQLAVQLHVADAVGAPNDAADLVSEAIAAVHHTRVTRSPGHRAAADPVGDRRELTEDLVLAIAGSGVEPWFQPIADTVTRRVVGWEALVRWEHPTRGLILPERFLPLAAAAGVWSQLTDRVLQRSLEFVARLNTELPGHQTRVHVNLSPLDLRSLDITHRVRTVIEQMGVDADQVVVEVTEDDILLLDDLLVANLRQLRELGAHLAIDDFGTGFSSLTHLLELPADHLKVDKRFARDLPCEGRNAGIVRGVLGLAHGLGLVTAAEGVETEAQAEALLALGCRQLQGHLIAPAVDEKRACEFARQSFAAATA